MLKEDGSSLNAGITGLGFPVRNSVKFKDVAVVRRHFVSFDGISTARDDFSLYTVVERKI